MKKELYIFGAGGLGREIAALVRYLPEWQVAGFIDDHLPPGTVVNGIVVRKPDVLLGNKSYVIVAIGNPEVKRRVVAQLPAHIDFPVLIHPTATILQPDTVHMGAGTVVTAGVVITCNVTIKEHVLLNLNATVGHDTLIGAFSSIMPGTNISGEVTIGDAVLVGSGSNVRNGVAIGNSARVAMGAVVVKDVEGGDTVAGVPARKLNSSSGKNLSA